jgi:hypothetical protein
MDIGNDYFFRVAIAARELLFSGPCENFDYEKRPCKADWGKHPKFWIYCRGGPGRGWGARSFR